MEKFQDAYGISSTFPYWKRRELIFLQAMGLRLGGLLTWDILRN